MQKQAGMVESLDGHASGKDGFQEENIINRKNSGLLNETMSKQGAFLPKNMTI